MFLSQNVRTDPSPLSTSVVSNSQSPPTGYYTQLRDLCTENSILLIADEVQSGFGRTGKYFAVEHYDVRPDILVMAKGIANGFPLSGIVSRKELMDRQGLGSMVG